MLRSKNYHGPFEFASREPIPLTALGRKPRCEDFGRRTSSGQTGNARTQCHTMPKRCKKLNSDPFGTYPAYRACQAAAKEPSVRIGQLQCIASYAVRDLLR